MNPIGVCSWSLRPTCPDDLADLVRSCGVTLVQLALDPIRRGEWSLSATKAALGRAGVSIVSGMMATIGEDYSTLESIKATGGVRPDATWPQTLTAAEADAEIAAKLDIRLVTFHAGFLPHNPANPLRATMIERLRRIADVYAAHAIEIAFETGQEDAPTLAQVLKDLDRPVGVNFDPANMILYGMGDPVEALRLLAPSVRQIHIKDALPAKTPGQWGTEVLAARGAVDWPAFVGVVRALLPRVPLIIEREAGVSRIEDIRIARRIVKAHLQEQD